LKKYKKLKDMKKIKAIALFILLIIGSNNINAQENYDGLNLLVNFGSITAVNANYEFTVAPQITVAPVVLIDFDGAFGIGAKGSYYFDSHLNLIDDFDVYGGLDVGLHFGNNTEFSIGAFAGGEWHIDEKWGLLFEIGGGSLSFGGSVGAAIHF